MWADRYNRRLLIVISDMVTAIATLVIIVAFMLGNYFLTIVLLVVLTVSGASGGIQSPAASAIIPGFVPAAHLRRINGLMGMVQALSSVCSPAIGGVVLAIWHLHAVFVIDILPLLLALLYFGFCESTSLWHRCR